MASGTHDGQLFPASDLKVEMTLRDALKPMIWLHGAGCVVTGVSVHGPERSAVIICLFRCIARVLFMLLLDRCDKQMPEGR